MIDSTHLIGYLMTFLTHTDTLVYYWDKILEKELIVIGMLPCHFLKQYWLHKDKRVLTYNTDTQLSA